MFVLLFPQLRYQDRGVEPVKSHADGAACGNLANEKTWSITLRVWCVDLRQWWHGWVCLVCCRGRKKGGAVCKMGKVNKETLHNTYHLMWIFSRAHATQEFLWFMLMSFLFAPLLLNNVLNILYFLCLSLWPLAQWHVVSWPLQCNAALSKVSSTFVLGYVNSASWCLISLDEWSMCWIVTGGKGILLARLFKYNCLYIIFVSFFVHMYMYIYFYIVAKMWRQLWCRCPCFIAQVMLVDSVWGWLTVTLVMQWR